MKKMPLVGYVKPTSVFTYLVGQNRTAQGVEQMRLAESKLDTFWEQVDKGFLAHTGETLEQWKGIVLEHRTTRRTEPWNPHTVQLSKNTLTLRNKDAISLAWDQNQMSLRHLR